MSQGKPKRRIRNFLLDARFQLKYTLAVVIISSAISAGLGVLLYQAHRESSQVASLDDPDLDGALRQELLQEDRRVLVYLVAFLGGLVLCLTGLGIVATHKIAGPAYAMKRKLGDIADGHLPVIRALRRGDELKEVADELRRMAQALRQREEAELAQLQKVVAALRGQPPGNEAALAELERLLREKKSRLGDEGGG